MKFIHFGCWNKGLCNKYTKQNGLSKTMSKLDTYVRNNPVDFIVVAGDNYYPEKTEATELTPKVKNMITDNFLSGIDCLPKSVKKYILLGNHEYDSMNVDGIEIDDKCYLLKLQKDIFNNEGNSSFFQDVMYERYTQTLIIMIDTTIYEMDKDNENQQIQGTCYTEVFNNLEEGTQKNTIKDLIAYQKYRVNELIRTNSDITNLIIIGHHPIIYVKSKAKKGKPTDKIDDLNGLCDLFKSFGNQVVGKKLYYLCADVHNYQTGDIKFNDSPIPKIHQYICGTGGAEQDSCGTQQNIELNEISYSNISCAVKFGFLVGDIEGSGVKFNFIDANIDDEPVSAAAGALVGGFNKKFYQKYLKYQTKYTGLLNAIN